MPKKRRKTVSPLVPRVEAANNTTATPPPPSAQPEPSPPPALRVPPPAQPAALPVDPALRPTEPIAIPTDPADLPAQPAPSPTMPATSPSKKRGRPALDPVTKAQNEMHNAETKFVNAQRGLTEWVKRLRAEGACWDHPSVKARLQARIDNREKRVLKLEQAWEQSINTYNHWVEWERDFRARIDDGVKKLMAQKIIDLQRELSDARAENDSLRDELRDIREQEDWEDGEEERTLQDTLDWVDKYLAEQSAGYSPPTDSRADNETRPTPAAVYPQVARLRRERR